MHDNNNKKVKIFPKTLCNLHIIKYGPHFHTHEKESSYYGLSDFLRLLK